MEQKKFFERLLCFYQQQYDVVQPFSLSGHVYDAYAGFRVTSSKYVLVKSAELWRACSYEHAFFKCVERLNTDCLKGFREAVISEIEPGLVRKGENCMPPNHMYTYITGIFVCNEISEAAIKEVKKFRYMKNYRLGVRGYTEARILVFDLEKRKIYGNLAAKEIVKSYRKVYKNFS